MSHKVTTPEQCASLVKVMFPNATASVFVYYNYGFSTCRVVYNSTGILMNQNRNLIAATCFFKGVKMYLEELIYIALIFFDYYIQPLFY